MAWASRSVTVLEHPAPAPAAAPEASGSGGPGPRRWAVVLRKLGYFLCGFGLFVTALGLMKAGATALIPALSGSIFTDSVWSTLGLGWLGACVVLSGSPIAASSLSLLDGGAISRTEAFTMLTGSRLGASFVVLVVGFLYAARRREGRKAPLSIGVVSLTMTVFAYLPGALVGFLLLNGGAFDGLHLSAPGELLNVTDVAFGWAPDLVKSFAPGWALFPIGLAVVLLAFKAFDRVLPSLDSSSIENKGEAWYSKTWLMFLLGCGVALVTLSVSMALTLLVPLVAKGYLKREHTIPYIAGANITTLADTLVAAMLIGNPDAARVVLAEMVGVTAWTLVLVFVFYPGVRAATLGIARTVIASPGRLAGFIGALFTVPLLLVAVG